MEINAERNEGCENDEELDGTIVRLYESIRRKITKANRKKKWFKITRYSRAKDTYS